MHELICESFGVTSFTVDASSEQTDLSKVETY